MSLTTIATLTSKRQITIPVQVRAALGLRPGDEIESVDLENGQFAIVPASVSQGRVSTKNNYLQLPAFRYPAAWASDSDVKET
ncbi:AbrB/MazE/SpoVT family DNA-binding domain-containing protein [Pseudomonas azerbaijanorientalis]|nr:AbrB/MazE/SpoVT family DNA-binding domain-containing protein [Pseudomonas azerbaijanorientalis]